MSKPSGTADEILNLPSGGGSVSGSGSSFSVDLNTGTATAQFNLILPAGPNGVIPPLSLQYSAGSGDGPFGLGWQLGLLEIQRKITPTVDPEDQTAAGTYSLTGIGDLVDMGNGRFRPTVDNSGPLIEFTGGAWTITDRNDGVCSLGTSANSQIGSNPPAAWLLDHCADSSGNAVVYQWLADGGARLPGTISWGTYQIIFKYEKRPDLLVDGSYGEPITIDERCNSIELHVTTETQSLVRSWQLLYDDNGGRGRSLLATIREQGHAADGTTLSAPDRSFAYSTPGAAELMPVTGWTTSLSDLDTDLVDTNGDGLPDILKMGAGLPLLIPNLGGANFGYPQQLTQAPGALRLSSPNVAFADMSGSGNADLLVLSEPLSGYYPLSAPGGTGPATFGLPVIFSQAPRVVLDDSHVRLLDLNGDGLTDILVDTGRSWFMYFREEANTWSDFPRELPAERTPPVSLTDSHVYLADMTGDGLTDVVRIDGGGVTYWPARADGGWDAPISMSHPPAFSRDHDPLRVTLVDVDGDGCADILYIGPTSVTLWRNTGATQLADPVVIEATPLATPGSYRVVDLLGSGTVGVHFELPQLRVGSSRQAFLDLFGGIKPYLMTDLINGPSQSTHVTYKTSTEYAMEDAAIGSPWETYHPFPIQCVARTDQTDHATGLVTSVQYTYHDGRYDPATRLFLGFGRVDSDQLGDATCPTLRVETVFHLGLDPNDPSRPLFGDEALKLGALRRKPLSTTSYGLDGSDLQGKPFSITLHTYDTLLVPSGLGDGNQVAVPYIATSTEQRWERQDAMWSSRLIEYLTVTENGDITLQRTRALRAGIATPDQDITTATTFATGGKNIRLPARTTQTGPDGTITSNTVTYYDGDAFEGLPEGQATIGLITRIENLAFTDEFVTSIWGANAPDLTTYGYHRLPGDTTGWWITRCAHERTTSSIGTVLGTKGPLGGLQLLQLDAQGQRVVGVTDSVGNTMTAVVNARVWQTESLTDANGHTTTDQFDALGRVTATVGPLDSVSSPWTTYAYAVGPISQINAATCITHDGPDVVATTTWLDGSGRVMGKSTPGAAAGLWIISGASSYNMRGLVRAAYLPYAPASASWQAPSADTSAVTYLYDAMGRITQRTRPDGLIGQVRNEGGTITFSETWPGGTTTDVERHVFDATGQLISVSRNAGDHWVEQTYTYFPSGKLNVVSLPGGGQITFGYDLLGRLFSYESPDSGRTIHLIDAYGNERSRTNSTGQIVRTEFDAANRITAVYYDAEATPRVKHEYLDQGDPAPADGITANRYARLWRTTDEIGTIVYQYDDSGKAISTQRTVAATSEQFLNQVTYDALGRTVSVVLPAVTAGAAGRTVEYGYGLDGRLISASGVVTQANYDLMGRMTSIVYENGTSTLIDYKATGSTIERIRVSDSSGALLRDMTATQSDGLVTGVASAVADDDSVLFLYDGMRRLASANYSQGATAADSHSWTYDDTYAITACSDSGALTYKTGTHQLASVGGQATVFDAAGRLTMGRYGTLDFDAADHLAGATMPNGVEISHTYDFCGRRSRTVTANQETYFSPTDNVEIQPGTTVVWISFGGQQLAADTGGALWFLHPNALGGKDLITDATGKVACRLRQTPYLASRPAGGSAPATTPAAVAFVLMGADATGLICQGRRWYDPAVGQFVSPDPIVSGVYVIGAWNPFIYCLGNPIILCDPSGCSFLTVLEAIGIALVAAICVAASVYTCGASIYGVAAMEDAYFGLMVGVSVGSFGGALSGALAAQKAGGNLFAGAFLGAFLGGLTSLVGGVLGMAAAYSINASIGAENTLASFIASGAIQGTLAGAGTGAAVGYAGGRGSVESVFVGLAKGAAWGATLGTALGYGIGSIVGTGWTGTDPPDTYLKFCDFANKFFNNSDLSHIVNSADDVMNVPQNLYAMALPGGQTPGNIFSNIVPSLLSTSAQKAGGFAISLSGVAGAVLYDAGFADAITLSMAADQAGFSYAELVFVLLGAAPYFIDFVVAMAQIESPSGVSSAETSFNVAYGSGNPNNT